MGVHWLAASSSAGAGSGAVGIKEATMYTAIPSQVVSKPDPWNKGRLIGQKSPLKPKDVWPSALGSSSSAERAISPCSI